MSADSVGGWQCNPGVSGAADDNAAVCSVAELAEPVAAAIAAVGEECDGKACEIAPDVAAGHEAEDEDEDEARAKAEMPESGEPAAGEDSALFDWTAKDGEDA
eukprot:jgi/Hompol1/2567/HPOL_002956-RA